MYLAFDAGNSHLKCFIWNEDSHLVHSESYSYDEVFSNKIDIPQKNAITKNIICNVSKYSTHEILTFLNISHCIEMSYKAQLPLQIAYETPQTLGSDRLAAAIGAESMYPKTPKLIVDFGTAITIDFVDGNAVFQGGNISLGMYSRFRALHEFTGKLPLLQQQDEISLMGKNTNEAIVNGVVQGICLEIEGYIEKYSSLYQDITIFLTGGDCHYFEKRLKNRIFADENLVAKGLLYMLQNNEKNLF